MMHTPVSWAVMPEDRNLDENGIAIALPHRGTYVYNTSATSALDYGGGSVCEFVHNGADARLIAAAPDLLAAMQELFEQCVMIHKHWGDGCNQKQADAAIQAARDAIAKATGE